jgi:hypothetical protein
MTDTSWLGPAIDVRPLLAEQQVLGDAENHHGRGVHDADEDPGEPDCRIDEVSPIVGKVPGTPGRLHSTTGLALRVGVRKTGVILRSPSPDADISHRCRVTLRRSSR